MDPLILQEGKIAKISGSLIRKAGGNAQIKILQEVKTAKLAVR
jgi:hypothetical protein